MKNNNVELKKWIEKELIIQEVTSYNILNSLKENVKKFIRLTYSGNIHLLPLTRTLPKYYQIYLYFIGKTYGHIIDLFDNEEVTNQEIEKNLKFPSGTIKYSL
jgi:hypothetical protein